MNCSNLEYFTKHSVCLRQNFQDITQIINVNLAMKLECSFVCFWSQNGTYIPNWLLFSSWLAISNVSNRWSLLYKVFHWFLVFLGNPEIAESFSLLFFKGVNAFELLAKLCKSFSVIKREMSKYCSKLLMQSENWLLRQFSSFAKSK